MDKEKAIEALKESLTEIPHLKKLSYDNDEDFQLWFDRLQIICGVLGENDLNTFLETGLPIIIFDSYTSYKARQDYYTKRLNAYEVNIRKILQKYKILGFEIEQTNNIEGLPPKAFIAHGGESPALRKLKNFLAALGVQPLVVEEQASEGRSVGEKVDWYSQQADCAIILATKGDIDGKTGDFIPRGNVLMEIGKLQHLFKGRIIYLLQSNTRFPSNISEKVWARFSPQSMDTSFTAIARELAAFGILKAVKP